MKSIILMSMLGGFVGGLLGIIPPTIQFHRDMQRIERQIDDLEAESRETARQIDALLPGQTNFTPALPK
jgi:hypothetical protein